MTAEAKSRDQRGAAKNWMKENNMSEGDFATMMNEANKHTISYDDINLILNKDRFAKNVASNTKKDVAKQVQNVRDASIPAVAAAGSADVSDLTTEDKIFDSLLNLDSNDNLFDS